MMKVVCACIFSGGKLLATRRGGQSDEAGKWEFPGGKVHCGETDREAVVREIMEELGITVHPQEQLAEVVYVAPGKTIRLLPFVCAIAEGRLQLNEHAEYRWITSEEINRLDWLPADRELIVREERFARLFYHTGEDLKNP